MAAFQLFSSLTRAEMAYKVINRVGSILADNLFGSDGYGDDRIDRVAGHNPRSHNQYFTLFYFIFTGS